MDSWQPNTTISAQHCLGECLTSGDAVERARTRLDFPDTFDSLAKQFVERI